MTTDPALSTPPPPSSGALLQFSPPPPPRASDSFVSFDESREMTATGNVLLPSQPQIREISRHKRRKTAAEADDDEVGFPRDVAGEFFLLKPGVSAQDREASPPPSRQSRVHFLRPRFLPLQERQLSAPTASFASVSFESPTHAPEQRGRAFSSPNWGPCTPDSEALFVPIESDDEEAEEDEEKMPPRQQSHEEEEQRKHRAQGLPMGGRELSPALLAVRQASISPSRPMARITPSPVATPRLVRPGPRRLFL